MAWRAILVVGGGCGHGPSEAHERGFHLRVADLGDDLQLRWAALLEAGGEVGWEGDEACDLLFLDGSASPRCRSFQSGLQVVLRKQLDDLPAYALFLLGNDRNGEPFVSGVQVA